ncbi:uncharacterized protein J4E88_003070 [Alternaria novae-zelandiae]|uniref:uncharacterized protein n=1 Tax=Alternaria novae-zelandiae TaxID=430562 RepID=UPI0020C2E5E0|nr:uncharacterized protein J4E88_003070 [Alternaria novae-zelandiae]KAI4687481.1 hypothetical protein J4E88_003070 [Alternaria novae-zelandiae]
MGASASKARATSMDFQVWEALLHTTQTQKLRPVSTNLTFDTTSYTIWSQKHWRLTFENAPPPKNAQLQPCFILKIPASQPPDYAQIIQQIEEVQAKDDVTSSSFLQHVVVASHGRSILELDVELAAALNARGLQTLTLATLQSGCDIETGPHLLHGSELWKVARLYDDTNGAFMAAIRPGEEDK